MGEYKKEKINNVIFKEASDKLRALYGWELVQPPDYMKDSLPTRYAERFYAVNNPVGDEDGEQAGKLHDRFDSGVNGLLITVLMIIYNKGELRNDTKNKSNFKWLTEEVSLCTFRFSLFPVSFSSLLLLLLLLFPPTSVPFRSAYTKAPLLKSLQSLLKTLNQIDDSIPESLSSSKRGSAEIEGLGTDMQTLLTRFVEQDYLIKDKVKVEDDSSGVYYTLGPRAALEVGRKQLIFFAANLLGEQPDPTMLHELEGSSDEEAEDE